MKGRGHLQLSTLACEEIEEIDVPVRSERDILTARQRGKALVDAAGFSASDATLISFVISELARDIFLSARRGQIVLSMTRQQGLLGVVIAAQYQGAAVPCLAETMGEHLPVSGRFGQGLPELTRLMDECKIVPEADRGTTVTVKKWKR